jgi:hypothetical protein
MKKLLVMMLLMGIVGICRAKDVRVTSSERLYRLLAQSPYSLVVFYDRSKDAMKDPATKQNILDLETMMQSLSKSPFYKDTDLQFIRVDISRQDVVDAVKNFSIQIVPTFMVFLGREPLTERLTGFAYRPQVMNFIDQNLKNEITQYMKKKEEQRKRELQMAQIRAYNQLYLWGPYWYTGYYPYWYGPYWW